MSEVKFTKGPWRLGCDLETVCLNHGNNNDFTRNGFAKSICKVKQNSWRCIEESVATATLIAAAPELYETAKNLIDDIRNRYPNEELRCKYMVALDNALSKARGE